MSVMRRYEISRGMSDTSVDVAIVGAGPYGLSLAAHLRAAGVSFRIFGQPMQGWVAHMPVGMRLKSEGFASNLYDPEGAFTLERFCRERGIPYADSGLPVARETFIDYGVAFQERFLPGLECKNLVGLDRDADGFVLRLADAERVLARRVVLAVGIAGYGYVPDELASLPAQVVTHSSRHADLQSFAGRRVALVGGGSSAIDLADLLTEAGAEVQLIARRQALRFHNPPTGEPRSRWQEIRYPMTGMGPGLRARLYTDAPLAFHVLPQKVRRGIVLDFAPPEGGWFSRERIIGRVPLLLGHSVVRARTRGQEVQLRLSGPDGSERDVVADHVIAATGYRVDLARLTFLSQRIRARLRSAYQTPVLSSQFESSVPGLYFVGLPAALSFGPMMRFALGAGYTARRLTGALRGSQSRDRHAHYLVRAANL